MRNYFSFLILALLLAVGCDKSNDSTDSNTQIAESFIFNEGTYLTPTISPDGGALRFGFTTNTTWSATTSETWLSVKPASGDESDNEFYVLISKNESSNERNATITVAYGTKSLAIEIKQQTRAELIATYEITYQTTDGEPIALNTNEGFGCTLIENNYADGYGTLSFEREVSAIPAEAFKGCNTLSAIILPETIQSIGNNAFENCLALTSIAIPEGVTTIGDFALYNCISLAEVSLAEGIQSVGSHAFAHCSALTAIVLPNSATAIADYAFSNCTTLNSVTLGNGIESLGNNTFGDCFALSSIALPESLKSIGEYTFANCGKLANITIPANTESIGEYAFFDCTALKSVECLSTTAPALGLNALHKYRYDKQTGGIEKLSYTPIACSIYVPATAVEAYKTADNWSDYASYIKTK